MRVYLYKLIKRNFEEIFKSASDNENQALILEYHRYNYNFFLNDSEKAKKLKETEIELYKKLRDENIDIDDVGVIIFGSVDMNLTKKEDYIPNENADGTFEIYFDDDGQMHIVDSEDDN